MHTGQLFMLYADPLRRIDSISRKLNRLRPPATEMRD